MRTKLYAHCCAPESGGARAAAEGVMPMLLTLVLAGTAVATTVIVLVAGRR